MASSINSYINPFSQGFHRATQEFSRLSTEHQITTVVVTILAGLATIFVGGILGYTAFRALVDHYKPKELGEDPTTDKTHHVVTVKIFQEPVQTPPPIDLKPEEPSKPKGINNIGNSCYINSSLQALLNTSLLKWIDNNLVEPEAPEDMSNATAMNRYLIAQEEYENKKAHLEALRNVRNVYEKSGSITEAVRELRRVAFGDNRLDYDFTQKDISGQQDAAQFLGVLLSAIGYDFQQTSHIFSQVEDSDSKEESLNMLKVAIDKDNNDLGALLDKHQCEKIHNPDNLWKGNKLYWKQQFISGEVPDTLVISLNRFRFDIATRTSKKISDSVTIPDEIDLRSFIDPKLRKEDVSTRYRLVAYVNHVGSSLGFGHYTANVKKEDGWYRCDDSRVYPDVNEAKRRQEAYILVLERVQ